MFKGFMNGFPAIKKDKGIILCIKYERRTGHVGALLSLIFMLMCWLGKKRYLITTVTT